MSFITQQQEWDVIKDELIEAWEKAGKPWGKEPTAHRVTTEQKKRMLARGERYMDFDDIMSEFENNGGKFIGQEDNT